MKKWSLIVFTIFSQMAVGAFWVLMAVFQYFASRYGSAQIAGLIVPPLIITTATMVFSLPISLAHLGSPLIAYRAISNFRSSWLSREITFALLFTLSSAAFTYMLWGQIGSATMRLVVAWLAVIFGFMLIYSMSRLYMLRTVPIWNTLFTPISFFLSALILGVLLIGVTFISSKADGFPSDAPLGIDALIMVTTGALLLLGCEFVLVIGRGIRFFSASSKEKETIQNLLDSYRSVFYNRLLLGVAGSTGLIIMLLQTRYISGFYAICFLLILLAELADRFLFYTARDFSGI